MNDRPCFWSFASVSGRWLSIRCFGSPQGRGRVKGGVGMKRLSRPWRVGFSVLGAVLLALLMPLATSSGVALAQASSSVDLSPAQGPPGILVTATGSGWAAGDSIQAIWGSDTGPYVGSTATVNSNGGFTLTFAVPSGTAAG